MQGTQLGNFLPAGYSNAHPFGSISQSGSVLAQTWPGVPGGSFAKAAADLMKGTPSPNHLSSLLPEPLHIPMGTAPPISSSVPGVPSALLPNFTSSVPSVDMLSLMKSASAPPPKSAALASVPSKAAGPLGSPPAAKREHGVVSAAATVISASSTVPGKRSKTSELDKAGMSPAKKIGSLLAAYDDDASGSDDDEQPAARAEPSISKVTSAVLVAHNWDHWQDMLNPRMRHGLVVGKPAAELVAGWPRHATAYPPGHPPAEPPGSCGSSCLCMDGLRVQKSELRKPWLEDAPGAADRTKAVQKALEAFTSQKVVLERGRQSKQHYLEPEDSLKRALEVSTAESELRPRSARRKLDELSESSASAIREALGAVPAESLLGTGFRLPRASLLPKEGSSYLPLRVEAEVATTVGQLSIAGHQVACSSSSTVLPEGASQTLRLRLYEGEVVVPAFTVGPRSVGQAFRNATVGLVEKIRALPPNWQPMFMEALGNAWDWRSGSLRQDVQLSEWLDRIERVRSQAQAASVAHVLPPAQEMVAPSLSSNAPAPPLGLAAPTWPKVDLASLAGHAAALTNAGAMGSCAWPSLPPPTLLPGGPPPPPPLISFTAPGSCDSLPLLQSPPPPSFPTLPNAADVSVVPLPEFTLTMPSMNLNAPVPEAQLETTNGGYPMMAQFDLELEQPPDNSAARFDPRHPPAPPFGAAAGAPNADLAGLWQTSKAPPPKMPPLKSPPPTPSAMSVFDMISAVDGVLGQAAKWSPEATVDLLTPPNSDAASMEDHGNSFAKAVPKGLTAKSRPATGGMVPLAPKGGYQNDY